MLKKTYEKMIKEMDAINNDGMEVYSNKMLNEIVSAFKETYINSADEVNTQAIIESTFYKLDKTKIREEAFLKNINNLLITLGVVGTLYNVIIIITQLTNMFKGIDVEVTSIQSVFGNVSTILGFVAMAFITSFVAILLAFIYSVIDSIFHVELERKNLFARLEDYLDNNLSANLSKQYPKMVNGLALDNYSNPNTLYKLENTQNAMMAMTSKLEQTISKLNENIKGVIAEESLKLENKQENKNVVAASAPVVDYQNKNDGLDEIFSDEVEDNNNSIFENQRQARLKLLEQTKKLQEQKDNELLNSISNGDVIPNANTEYVDEATIEAPKAEEFLKKEEVFSEPSSIFAPVENEFARTEEPHHEMQSVGASDFANTISSEMERKVQDLVQGLIKEQVSTVPPVVQPQPLPSGSSVMNVPNGAFQQDAQVQTQSEMTVIPKVPTLQTSALGVETDETPKQMNTPQPLQETTVQTIQTAPEAAVEQESAPVIPEIHSSVADEIKNRPDGAKTLTVEDLDRLKQELIQKQRESEAIKQQLEQSQNQNK